MRVLITGATGKVGRAFLAAFAADPRYREATAVALCHNRLLEPRDGLEVIRGSIADRKVAKRVAKDITHVIHMATCKETAEDVMDVTVKGLFWLLEECRSIEGFEQFMLIGGDAAVGHFFYPRAEPVTERQPHSAYPGCYALSKVLEEVMLEQYRIQYGLPCCCLRAPWIMEKDDFKFSLSFGPDVFGGPRWCDLVDREQSEKHHRGGTVPLMLDPDGEPVRRNFVHVDDLVAAMLAALDRPDTANGQTFNICMDEPVDYRKVAEYLAQTRSLDHVAVRTPYHSTWLDNAKAKFLLGWRPLVDYKELIERAWNYQRAPDDPRKIWYPG